MADPRSRAGISDGPSSRPLDDTVAQTGPGIPDDAASDGYDPVADADAEHEEEGGAEPPSSDTLFSGP